MSNKLNRRRFIRSIAVTGAVAGAAGGAYGVWNARGIRVYADAVKSAFRDLDGSVNDEATKLREIARYATMAPNSHNTQPWMIRIENLSLTFSPDLTRRCSVVDPDDHDLHVSLGCAAENALTRQKPTDMKPRS